MILRILFPLLLVCSVCRGQDSTSVVCTWVGFSPDGNLLAAGVTHNTFRGQKQIKIESDVQLYSATTGELLRSFRAHEREINSIVFHPTKKNIVTVSNDGTSIIWDYATGKMVDTLDRFSYYTMSDAVFNRDGSLIATSTYGKVRVWDFEKRKLKYSLPHDNWSTRRMEFLEDGNYFVTYPTFRSTNYMGDNFYGRSLLWELSTGRFLKVARVNNTLVSPGRALDSTRKYTAFSADSVELKGKELVHAAKSETTNFCSCKNLIATEIDGKLVLWDRTTNKQIGPAWAAPEGESMMGFNCMYLLTTKGIYSLPEFKNVTPTDAALALWELDETGLPIGRGLKLDPSGDKLVYMIRKSTGETSIIVDTLPSGKELFSVVLR